MADGSKEAAALLFAFLETNQNWSKLESAIYFIQKKPPENA